LGFVREAETTNAFSRLSRYEATIERSLYNRALDEFQRLQAARAQGSRPAPAAALDADVSGLPGEGA
jgi:hypothetical protein